MKSRLLKKLEKLAFDFANGMSDYVPKHYILILDILTRHDDKVAGMMDGTMPVFKLTDYSPPPLTAIDVVLGKTNGVEGSRVTVEMGYVLAEKNVDKNAEQRRKLLEWKKAWNERSKEYKKAWMDLYVEQHNYGDRPGGIRGRWTASDIERAMDESIPTCMVAKELKRNVTSVSAMRCKVKRERAMCNEGNGMELAS